MKVEKVGVIGHGFVGSSISFGLSPVIPVLVYDKDPLKSVNSMEEVVKQSDVIFVSVPTPMNKNGSINLNIVYSALEEISTLKPKEDTVIVLKSTVIPGTTREMRNNFPNLNIVFNPEFLTERTAKFDFMNQARIVLGGYPEATKRVAELYNMRFQRPKIIETDYETAEFIKYFNNVFFAVKVAFCNEMKRLVDEVGADWDTALEGFVSDGRVGDSHVNVPGPDGKWGFGGSCFPKDINAFADFARSLGLSSNIAEAAWKTNLEVRPEKDWEQLKGRAVSDE